MGLAGLCDALLGRTDLALPVGMGGARVLDGFLHLLTRQPGFVLQAVGIEG